MLAIQMRQREAAKCFLSVRRCLCAWGTSSHRAWSCAALAVRPGPGRQPPQVLGMVLVFDEHRSLLFLKSSHVPLAFSWWH